MDRIELAIYIFLGVLATVGIIGFIYLLWTLFDFFRLLWMGKMSAKIALARRCDDG